MPDTADEAAGISHDKPALPTVPGADTFAASWKRVTMSDRTISVRGADLAYTDQGN